MKYRLLTTEELANLEEEFVHYLVVNGITADDWEKMKQEQNEQAQEIMHLFSDVIFEGIFRKVTHLERVGKEYVQFVSCGEKEMKMIALRATPKTKLDLSEGIRLKDLTKEELKTLDVYQGRKTYQKTREEELFDLVQHQNYFIAEGERFEALERFIS